MAKVNYWFFNEVSEAIRELGYLASSYSLGWAKSDAIEFNIDFLENEYFKTTTDEDVFPSDTIFEPFSDNPSSKAHLNSNYFLVKREYVPYFDISVISMQYIFELTHDFCLEMWFKVKPDFTFELSAPIEELSLSLIENPYNAINIQNGDNSKEFTQIFQNKWNYLAFTRGDNCAKFYLNGNLKYQEIAFFLENDLTTLGLEQLLDIHISKVAFREMRFWNEELPLSDLLTRGNRKLSSQLFATLKINIHADSFTDTPVLLFREELSKEVLNLEILSIDIDYSAPLICPLNYYLEKGNCISIKKLLNYVEY